MSLRKVACFALVALLVVSCLVGQSEAGKLKKIAKLAILGKALAPKIIPIPLPIHFSKGHSYVHHDPWQMGGHGGGHGGGGWW